MFIFSLTWFSCETFMAGDHLIILYNTHFGHEIEQQFYAHLFIQ